MDPKIMILELESSDDDDSVQCLPVSTPLVLPSPPKSLPPPIINKPVQFAHLSYEDISGYIIFSKNIRYSISKSNAHLSYDDVTQILLKKWSLLAPELKKHWEKRAVVSNRARRDKYKNPIIPTATSEISPHELQMTTESSPLLLIYTKPSSSTCFKESNKKPTEPHTNVSISPKASTSFQENNKKPVETQTNVSTYPKISSYISLKETNNKLVETQTNFSFFPKPSSSTSVQENNKITPEPHTNFSFCPKPSSSTSFQENNIKPAEPHSIVSAYPKISSYISLKETNNKLVETQTNYSFCPKPSSSTSFQEHIIKTAEPNPDVSIVPKPSTSFQENNKKPVETQKNVSTYPKILSYISLKETNNKLVETQTNFSFSPKPSSSTSFQENNIKLTEPDLNVSISPKPSTSFQENNKKPVETQKNVSTYPIISSYTSLKETNNKLVETPTNFSFSPKPSSSTSFQENNINLTEPDLNVSISPKPSTSFQENNKKPIETLKNLNIMRRELRFDARLHQIIRKASNYPIISSFTSLKETNNKLVEEKTNFSLSPKPSSSTSFQENNIKLTEPHSDVSISPKPSTSFQENNKKSVETQTNDSMFPKPSRSISFQENNKKSVETQTNDSVFPKPSRSISFQENNIKPAETHMGVSFFSNPSKSTNFQQNTNKPAELQMTNNDTPNSKPVYKLCRLCGLKKPDSINIFTNGLHLKVTKLMPITININDNLPNTICSQCEKSVQLLSTFIYHCVKTQHELAKKLVTLEIKQSTQLIHQQTENREVPYPCVGLVSEVNVFKEKELKILLERVDSIDFPGIEYKGNQFYILNTLQSNVPKKQVSKLIKLIECKCCNSVFNSKLTLSKHVCLSLKSEAIFDIDPNTIRKKMKLTDKQLNLLKDQKNNTFRCSECYRLFPSIGFATRHSCYKKKLPPFFNLQDSKSKSNHLPPEKNSNEPEKSIPINSSSEDSVINLDEPKKYPYIKPTPIKNLLDPAKCSFESQDPSFLNLQYPDPGMPVNYITMTPPIPNEQPLLYIDQNNHMLTPNQNLQQLSEINIYPFQDENNDSNKVPNVTGYPQSYFQINENSVPTPVSDTNSNPVLRKKRRGKTTNEYVELNPQSNDVMGNIQQLSQFTPFIDQQLAQAEVEPPPLTYFFNIELNASADTVGQEMQDKSLYKLPPAQRQWPSTPRLAPAKEKFPPKTYKTTPLPKIGSVTSIGQLNQQLLLPNGIVSSLPVANSASSFTDKETENPNFQMTLSYQEDSSDLDDAIPSTSVMRLNSMDPVFVNQPNVVTRLATKRTYSRLTRSTNSKLIEDHV